MEKNLFLTTRKKNLKHNLQYISLYIKRIIKKINEFFINIVFNFNLKQIFKNIFLTKNIIN